MPKLSKPSPLMNFIKTWHNCKLCNLCENRLKVCLVSGTIPCDALFIGEAPGASEDVLGEPFVGPAGILLKDMIEDAITEFNETRDGTPEVAFTNLVACIPRADDGHKFKEPDKEHIQACSKRLQQITNLCQPKLIVRVGKLADKWAPIILKEWSDIPSVSIMHPAFILRADEYQKPMAIKRTIVTIRDAFLELP